MYKPVLVATAVGAAVLTTVATPHTTFATSGDKHDHTKVTICHRTGSATNPYVKITVSSSAAYGGHDHRHEGPVATNTSTAATLKSQHVEWGDIIPADATHAGSNWTTEGKAVYDNDCGCIDKTGPVVGPVENTHEHEDKDTPKPHDTPKSDDCTPTPAPTPKPTPAPTPAPGKGGDTTPASTPAPTPVTPAQPVSTPVTPVVPTATELPHTGTSSNTLITGSLISLLAGIAVYGVQSLRARFSPRP